MADNKYRAETTYEMTRNLIIEFGEDFDERGLALLKELERDQIMHLEPVDKREGKPLRPLSQVVAEKLGMYTPAREA